MRDQLDLVGIGSMVVDVIRRTPRLISAEEKIALDSFGDGAMVRRVVGGVVLNHLAWARALGLQVGVFGKQGNDQAGRFIRTEISRLGIDQEILTTGTASSESLVFVDRSGERAIYMSPGATASVGAEEIHRDYAEYIRRARMVSTEISQLPLDAVVAVMEIAHHAGSVTVLDLDVPPSEAGRLGSPADLERALQLAHYLKSSRLAAQELTGRTDALGAARALRDRYATRAAVVTDGPRGCSLAAEGYSGSLPAYPAQVVDTTGAGDAFWGGFLAGLHYGLSWEDAARLANACGAACCEVDGAFPVVGASRARCLALYDGTPCSPLPFPAESEAGGAGAPAAGSFLGLALEQLDILRQQVSSEALDRAARMILDSQELGGRVHVMGVGKPEHVARYIASLMASTGTPAYFLHATECVHGCAGQVLAHDVVIAVSNSGSTGELLGAVKAVKAQGAQLIAVSSNDASPLARASDVFLYAGAVAEGGVLNLPPRVSILAETLVLQALSVELEVRKGLTADQYRGWHPGGDLGRRAEGMGRKK
ncbi:MAG: SIS domain-containing protein [Acidobacteria bacterium]|nr:SIS domain-containing protein [Acidobacteriota bacterium]